MTAGTGEVTVGRAPGEAGKSFVLRNAQGEAVVGVDEHGVYGFDGPDRSYQGEEYIVLHHGAVIETEDGQLFKVDLSPTAKPVAPSPPAVAAVVTKPFVVGQQVRIKGREAAGIWTVDGLRPDGRIRISQPTVTAYGGRSSQAEVHNPKSLLALDEMGNPLSAPSDETPSAAPSTDSLLGAVWKWLTGR